MEACSVKSANYQFATSDVVNIFLDFNFNSAQSIKFAYNSLCTVTPSGGHAL